MCLNSTGNYTHVEIETGNFFAMPVQFSDARNATDLLQVVDFTGLLQLVDNLQQAGKIHNLKQVCGISGCV